MLQVIFLFDALILEHLIPSGDHNGSGHDAQPWKSQAHSFCPSSSFDPGIRHRKMLVPCRTYDQEIKFWAFSLLEVQSMWRKEGKLEEFLVQTYDCKNLKQMERKILEKKNEKLLNYKRKTIGKWRTHFSEKGWGYIARYILKLPVHKNIHLQFQLLVAEKAKLDECRRLTTLISWMTTDSRFRHNRKNASRSLNKKLKPDRFLL